MANESEPVIDSGRATDPMLPHPYRIAQVRNETRDTFTFDLAPANGTPGTSFAPGQFNMLYVFGVGEAPISISGDPAAGPKLLHTTRTVGTVTRALRRLKRGDIIGMRGPSGRTGRWKKRRGATW